MKVVDRNTVTELAERSDEWCVSLFVPPHEPGAAGGGDKVIMKNLLASARDELSAVGLRRPDIDHLLGDITFDDLADRRSHAFHRGGVAIFAAPSFLQMYRVNTAMPELAMVERRFHLKPLLAELALQRELYVLALSRGAVHLYRTGVSSKLTTVEVEGMPATMTEALAYDDREAVLTSHSGSAKGTGRVAPVFHGQGGRADALETDTRRFLQQVDKAVAGVVADAAVVLAGVPELVAHYRSITTLRPTDRDIFGDPGSLTASQFDDRTRQIIEELVAAEQKADLERLNAVLVTDNGSTDLNAIAAAAAEGRVGIIFVAADTHVWGQPGEAADTDRPGRRAGDRDVLDEAAMDAWRTGATVHVIDAARIPGFDGAAASFRY
ncbi:MAG: hypothetical protein OEM97_07035 [Acidimicrobiia bacterium]|nr:hypothetical protein [Acidimicrobiia bacterium]